MPSVSVEPPGTLAHNRFRVYRPGPSRQHRATWLRSFRALCLSVAVPRRPRSREGRSELEEAAGRLPRAVLRRMLRHIDALASASGFYAAVRVLWPAMFLVQ